jgi:hypothetical protein
MGSPVTNPDADHVESTFTSRMPFVSEKVASRGDEPTTLAPIDRVYRISVIVSATSLHLDEGQHAAVSYDEIDLAALTSVASREYHTALRLQIPGDKGLCRPSQRVCPGGPRAS